MDEDIAIINQNTKISLIKNFFKKNINKIIILILNINCITILFYF